MQKCKECNRTKRAGLFSYRKTICNSCFRGTPAYRVTRDRYLRETYGITLTEYEILLEFNGGSCWICEGGSGGKNLAVDHDHKTGQVRGLLCKRCNTLIGRYRDRIKTFLNAGTYLEDSGQVVNILLARTVLTPADTAGEV